MAKAKNNNGLYIGIAVAVVVVIAIIIAVVVANNRGDGGGSDSGGSSAVEYSTIDESISYGEYNEMEKLSKAIQNGEMVGKVVKVEGLVSHPMSTYSIVQPNEDGSKKIGTQFIISDADDSEYPEDGDTVVITGEVVENSPMVFVIKTTKDNVEKQ